MNKDSRAQDVGWDLIRTFSGVMRAGSLSAAAASLGITQPTAGRQIRALEAALGEPLFERKGNLLAPTARAIALHERAQAMDDAAAGFHRLIGRPDEAIAGTVRVSMPEAFAVHFVPPLIAGFMERHPQIEIEVVSSNATDDLHRREADIAVRLYRPTQDGLTMRKVGRVEIGVFASPDYLSRAGEPETLRDFQSHRMIGDDRATRLLDGMAGMGVKAKRGDFSFRCDAVLAQIAAIEAGIGIGSAMVAMMDPARTRRILASEVSIWFDVHVVAHSDVLRSRRVRAAFDHLAEGLRQTLG